MIADFVRDGTIFFLPLAILLGYFVYRRSPASLYGGLRNAFSRFVEMIPRVILSIVAAGFVGKLLPPELIANQLGPESGFYGILIATLAGSFIPAGPIVTFPIVIVLLKAGAGFPQVVAFLSAWSVYAFSRMLTYEIPIVGLRFSTMRLLASLPMPFVAAYLTELAIYVWPLK